MIKSTVFRVLLVVVTLALLSVAGCTPLQRRIAAGAGVVLAIGMIKAHEEQGAPGTVSIPRPPDCTPRPEVCR